MPIALIVIAVVVVLILFWVISTYNKFVKLQNKVEEAFSTMDVYLKTDQHFAKLQTELQNIESEIANARKYYNAVCVKFNNLVEMFPSNLLAGMFHKTKKPLYEIDDAAQRENVKVQF